MSPHLPDLGIDDCRQRLLAIFTTNADGAFDVRAFEHRATDSSALLRLPGPDAGRGPGNPMQSPDPGEPHAGLWG